MNITSGDFKSINVSFVVAEEDNQRGVTMSVRGFCWSSSSGSKSQSGPSVRVAPRSSVLRDQRESFVVLDVQLLVRVVWHVRVPLRAALLLRGPGARHAAARLRRLRGRWCLSLLRAPGPRGLGRVVSRVAPPAGGAVLIRLPLTPREIFLMQIMEMVNIGARGPFSNNNNNNDTNDTFYV